ncbi:hypothetical protein [Streptomyces sp. NPDC002889]|uniref:hypothetical protein n=1 Tax=Streptomyces sp. NPDC002889 TaxID=3364669 RepID=UPI003673C933
MKESSCETGAGGLAVAVRGGWAVAAQRVVTTYRPKESFSFGSLPEAGPKPRHHSTHTP